MKVFVLTDLEGVSGVIGRPDSIGNKILNVETSGQLLTGEVNAVADGLFAAGAKEIVVWDGHGGSNSIDIRNLREGVLLYQSGGRGPVTIMDSSYDALVQIGAHAMMGTPDGFLNHTDSSRAIVEIQLNGTPVGEIGLASLLAACFNVPTIMVSGDRAACREAGEFLTTVEVVETKVGVNRYSAINRNPLEVRKDLTGTAEKALSNKAQYPLLKMTGNYILRIQYMCPNQADTAEMRGAVRINPVTVEYSGNDFINVYSRYAGWSDGVHAQVYG
ncbi:MAG: M55 family metallopeptidase [Victivallaceae bacterium]|nr:M55 family metallopeptidase [Victivallaceae bacterium]